MRRLAVILFALVAAGCAAAAPPAAPPPVTTAGTPTSTAALDCAKADGDVEQMICKDPRLGSLDRQLAAEFARATSAATADATKLQAAQDSWQSRRDDCWKADDVRACVLEAYQTRLAELTIADPATPQPAVMTYRCPGPKPFTAQFFNDFDPKAALLTWGDDTAIVFIQPSGSGARYGRDGVQYWEHQGEVTVTFNGSHFVCQTPPTS